VLPCLAGIRLAYRHVPLRCMHGQTFRYIGLGMSNSFSTYRWPTHDSLLIPSNQTKLLTRREYRIGNKRQDCWGIMRYFPKGGE